MTPSSTEAQADVTNTMNSSSTEAQADVTNTMNPPSTEPEEVDYPENFDELMTKTIRRGAHLVVQDPNSASLLSIVSNCRKRK